MSQIKTKHNHPECRGLGEVVASSSISTRLRTILQDSGFDVKSLAKITKLGMGESLKYACVACPECRKWLRS